jgi:hypothetical protein
MDTTTLTVRLFYSNINIVVQTHILAQMNYICEACKGLTLWGRQRSTGRLQGDKLTLKSKNSSQNIYREASYIKLHRESC